MNGKLEQAGDHWQLRFRRELAHPAEKVWRALTEPEHLKAWFPDHIHVDGWEVGARLEFSSDYDGIEPFDGEVLAFEPPSLLEFRWGTDTIRFDVEPRGDSCVLTLTDTIDELGKAARDAAGWHACLDALEAALDGSAEEGPSEERWAEVHPGYVEEFGPDAATVGPPE